MSNQRKNSNYTPSARKGAANKLQSGSRGAGPITRFFLGKTNILECGQKKHPIPYVLFAFLIPLIGGILAMHFRCKEMMESTSGYEFSLLYSDAYYQYYPFFVDFRNLLRSGGSFLYTWDIGMGTDYLGLFAYYVGSPLNWISALIPEGWLMNYYTLLVPIRMGFAGLFFAIFLQKVFDKNDITITLFGCFYATCAWVTGYLWNTMWLDSFALMPLVILGTYNLLKYRKFLLYTVSLFFAICTNYYIGFFICIFTLLVFICYQVVKFTSWKRLLQDLGLMALFTTLSIGMTALITLPTFASLQTTYSSGTGFPKDFKLLIAKEQGFGGLIEAMITVASNSFAMTEPNFVSYASAGGLPNIYCGVFACVLGTLYLTCKQISWRERICTLALLLFINLSFIIEALDYIWHGFHTTNAIPNRFSFIYSFILLTMAYRAWTLRRRIEPWQVMVSIAVVFIGLMVSPAMEASRKTAEDAYIQEDNFLLNNLLLILLYGIALMCYCFRDELPKKTRWNQKRPWYRKLHLRRSLGALAMVGILIFELVLNFITFSHMFREQNIANYPLQAEDTQKAIQFMKSQEGESGFYRTETSQHQTYNDGMLNGYYGISTFSSAANVKVTNFTQAIGLSAKDNYNRYVYEEATPVAHLFLNLKYILERANKVEPNNYLTDVYTSGKVHLMRNEYYLPLGFMTDPALKDLAFVYDNDPFGFQNRLLSAALGQQVTPWTVIKENNVVIPDGITAGKFANGKPFYTVETDGYVTFEYKFDRSGLFCVNYDLAGKNYYYAYLNGKELHNDKHNGLAFIGSVCQVEPGDTVKIKVKCTTSTSRKVLEITGALLDRQVMEDAYRQLSQSTMEITRFEDTLVEGTISCPTAGLMYTSIPQVNGNWHAYVDGKEAQITLIGDAMVGVMLTEGTHSISFRYENSAFRTGLTISITCAVLLLGVYGYLIVRKKKHIA